MVLPVVLVCWFLVTPVHGSVCEDKLHEVQLALGDKKESLRDAEAKLASSQAAFAQLHTEMETRLREKDEEIDNIRRSSVRAIEKLQRPLIKVKTSDKVKITSIKKYKTNIKELEGALDSTNKANAVYRKQIRALKQRVKQRRDLKVQLSQLQADPDKLSTCNESAEASLKKMNYKAVNDLTDQLEHMTKQKNRLEKEKHQLIIEIDSLQVMSDFLAKAKFSAVKRAYGLQDTVDRLKAQVDDLTRQLNDASSVRVHLTQENFDLQRQVQELDSVNAALAKAQLQCQNDDLKRQLDDESRSRIRELEDALDFKRDPRVRYAALAKAQLQGQNDDLKRQLDDESRVVTESRVHDTQCQFVKDEESRFQARIRELEDALDFERDSRFRAEKNLSEMTFRCDQLADNLEEQGGVTVQQNQVIVQNLTKIKRALENENAALQRRVDEFAAKNQVVRAEKANLEDELYRLRVANAELLERNDNLQRENKAVSDHLREANLALKEANHELNEVRQLRAQLEMERDSLAAQLRETEEALRDAEAKLAAAEAALAQLRTEMETRLREKEEIDNIRRSSARAIVELQHTLIEVEIRYKTEITRIKKKHETDIRELEGALDNANKTNAEYLKQIRDLQQRVKELEVLLDEERRAADDLRSQLTISERKRIALQQEVDDVRSLLEAAEKAHKNAENELADASARVSELQIQVTALTNDKRRMEVDITAMQFDLEDAINARRAAEERVERLHYENIRLADDLKQGQDNYKNAESLRKQLEIEIREITVRLEKAEAFATREGKTMVANANKTNAEFLKDEMNPQL